MPFTVWRGTRRSSDSQVHLWDPGSGSVLESERHDGQAVLVKVWSFPSQPILVWILVSSERWSDKMSELCETTTGRQVPPRAGPKLSLLPGWDSCGNPSSLEISFFSSWGVKGRGPSVAEEVHSFQEGYNNGILKPLTMGTEGWKFHM